MSATICSEKLFFSAKYVTTSVPGSESNFNMNILSVSHASTNETYTRENRRIKKCQAVLVSFKCVALTDISKMICYNFICILNFCLICISNSNDVWIISLSVIMWNYSWIENQISLIENILWLNATSIKQPDIHFQFHYDW